MFSTLKALVPESIRKIGREGRVARMRAGSKAQLRMRLDPIPPYPSPSPPEGYSFVEYSPEMDEAWRVLIDQSSEFGAVDRASFRENLLDHMIPGTVSLIADSKGELVACFSACALPAFMPDATLSYLIVKPEARGNWLGKIATIRTLARLLAVGYRSAVLNTDDERVAALNLYYELGFLPVMDVSEDAPERWRAVPLKAQARLSAHVSA